jgi:DNA-directed RNA polymerase specialized sigma24 family protein
VSSGRRRAAARDEAVPSAAPEIVEREALRAGVVRAVLELEEPYRATVLLRLLREPAARTVARRLAVPWRPCARGSKRAIAQLRLRSTARPTAGAPRGARLLQHYAAEAARWP